MRPWQIAALSIALAGFAGLLMASPRIRIRPWVVLISGIVGFGLVALVNILITRCTSLEMMIMGILLVCVAGPLVMLAVSLFSRRYDSQDVMKFPGGSHTAATQRNAGSPAFTNGLAYAQDRELALISGAPAKREQAAKIAIAPITAAPAVVTQEDTPAKQEIPHEAPPETVLQAPVPDIETQASAANDQADIERLADGFRREQDRLVREEEKHLKKLARLAREEEDRKLEQERLAHEEEETRQEQERLAHEETEKRREQERLALEDTEKHEAEDRAAREAEEWAAKEAETLRGQEQAEKEVEKRRRDQERRASREEALMKEEQQRADSAATPSEAQLIRERIREERARIAREENSRQTDVTLQYTEAQGQAGAQLNAGESWEMEQERLARELEKRRIEQEKAAVEERRWLEEQERLARETEMHRLEQERLVQEAETRRLEQERLQRQEMELKQRAAAEKALRKEREARIAEAGEDMAMGVKFIGMGMYIEALPWLEKAAKLDTTNELKLQASLAIVETLAALGWKAEALKKMQTMKSSLSIDAESKKRLGELAVKLIG